MQDSSSQTKGDLRPRLPVVAEGERLLAAREPLRGIQSFFVGQEAAPPLPSGLYPALLGAFRDASRIRTPYPLFVPCEDGPCQSLDEVLAGAAPSVRLLTDNLRRAERLVRAQVGEAPVGMAEALQAVRPLLLAELSLRPEHAAELSGAWDQLMAAVPAGRLLPYGEAATLQLFLHAVRQHRAKDLAAFRNRAVGLRRKLAVMLQVDDAKRPEARTAEALSRQLGGSGALLSAAGIADVASQRPQLKMFSAERRERVQRLLAVLDSWLSAGDPPTLVVHRDAAVANWGLHAQFVADDDAFACAMRTFDSAAAEFSRVVRAVRAGELEIAGEWKADLHGPWLDGFDWQAFSRSEFALLPVVVVYVDARDAASSLQALSASLLSGRPIHVVAPGTASAPSESQGGSSFALDLGLVAMGLRHAYVQQSSDARPVHLVEGFREALEGTRASLHLVGAGFQTNGIGTLVGAWLHAGAALEGRAHPFFRFNPERGISHAAHFHFGGNESVEADWAHYPLEVVDSLGAGHTLDLAFTYADFALLEAVHTGEFFALPAEMPVGNLVDVVTWLSLPAEETVGRIPFVWGVDAENQLHRVALSHAMALLTRDRLATWHTLQEMAGIRNPYAIRAAEEAWTAARVEARAEMDRLTVAHEAELDRVRRESADEAMRRLTTVLLDADFSGSLVGATTAKPVGMAPVAAPVLEGPAVEAPVAAAEVAVAAVSSGEPYIDSFLCTSCSECININKLLFVFDGNKQATIGDASKGSFKELVNAAEKCPARCIHPGKPKNQSEPGLDELISRAARFN